MAAGESVLVVAHSNAAVDVAMQGIARNMQATPPYREGKILRFGVVARTELAAYPSLHVRGIVREQHPQLIDRIEAAEERRRKLIAQSRRAGLSPSEQQHIKDQIAFIKEELRPLKEQLKQHESNLVRAATVVGCTLSKATIAQEIYQRRFDAVVIDEASMAYIPHCAFVSSLAHKRVAIFGDFRQLAPIAQAETAAVQQWLQRDIFAQAGITARVNAGGGDSRLVRLQEQHRMHPAIAGVINANFYGGQLINAPGTAARATGTVQKAPHAGEALVCYDLTPLTASCFSDRESHSRFNPVSALAAVQLAQQGLAAGQGSIGIVTPYNAQSRLIYRLLKDCNLADKPVRVATVHRFQGDENDLIIFDAVDGEPQSKAGRLLQGGMDSTAMRLINVAISRARGKFIGLFNRTYLRTHLDPTDSVHALLHDLTTRTPITAATWSRRSPHSLFHTDLPGLALLGNSQEAQEPVMQDLRTAREEIAIAWPTRLTPDYFNPGVLHQCDASKVRFFISGAGSSAFHIGLRNMKIFEGHTSPAIGLVGIDRSRLWLYLNPADPRAPVLRLDLPQTVKLLAAFWGLVPEEELTEHRALNATCPQCKSLLWLATGKYGVYLRCTSDACAYTRSITPAIATDIARLNGVVCGHCGGMVKGRKGPTGVFLGCANYPACTWRMSLDSLV